MQSKSMQTAKTIAKRGSGKSLLLDYIRTRMHTK